MLRAESTIEFRANVVRNTLHGVMDMQIDGNFARIIHDGKTIAFVDLLNKRVKSAKGRKWHPYIDDPKEALQRAFNPPTAYCLKYYHGTTCTEVVVKKGSYVYCTVVKSQKQASGNYRLGFLKIEAL